MNTLEKWYTFIIFGSVVLGIMIGRIDNIRVHAEIFIMPLLIGMLYITFLQVPLGKIRLSYKNVRFTIPVIMMNFLWSPLLAWGLAHLFLADHSALWIGFIMLMVTPCTDWYLIFTGLAKGNVALSTAILPINLVLQIILLPLYILVFSGSTATIASYILIERIFFVLLLPLLLAWITKGLLNRRPNVEKKIMQTFGSLPIMFLSLAILAMFASQGTILFQQWDLLWKLAVPILSFFIINFIIGQWAGQLLHFSYPDQASFSLTTLARNSPIALAVALSVFPDQPLIALTLVIGPLLELPILASVTQVLLRLKTR